MLTAPYVHFNNNNNNNTRKVHHEQQQQQEEEENRNVMTMIDYTNLYIKNLDSEVTSYDLFKRFKVFGKIISARVMKDTMTSKSKGYGFVSFTHMEEANEALQQMNGVLVNTKHIVVTFHEHKKQVQQKNKPIEHHSNSSTSYPSPQSISYPNYGFIPEQQKTPLVSNNNTNPWNETGIWMHNNNNNNNTSIKSPVVVPHPAYHHTSSSSHNNNNMHIQQQQQQQTNNNTSLVSSSSSFQQQQQQENIQYQKLRDAIYSQLSEYQYKDLNDLVDLIQSLRKRDLSLCLFNPTFLKQKIDEAYEALYLFQNNQQQQQVQQNGQHAAAATAILSSLEGMSMNKKKRVFGDIFFPYVRATGVKHAPKVTIRLLDTIPLDELAFNMYDKLELTKRAQYAYHELYG